MCARRARSHAVGKWWLEVCKLLSLDPDTAGIPIIILAARPRKWIACCL